MPGPWPDPGPGGGYRQQ
nr:hypothetical protein [Xanthomonas oryzae]